MVALVLSAWPAVGANNDTRVNGTGAGNIKNTFQKGGRNDALSQEIPQTTTPEATALGWNGRTRWTFKVGRFYILIQ